MPRPEQHVEESTTGSNGSEKGPATMNGWPKRATQADDEPAVPPMRAGSRTALAADHGAPAQTRSSEISTQTGGETPPGPCFLNGASFRAWNLPLTNRRAHPPTADK